MPKFFHALTAIVAVGLFAFACTQDASYEGVYEPPCPNEIIDEDYKGPWHMALGIGLGGLGAMDIALDNPELFATAASLGGPVDLELLLGSIKARLDAPDDWDDLPSRVEYFAFLRDIFIALGNPCYFNPASAFYPPGVTGGTQQIVTGVPTPDSPDGSVPLTTFFEGEDDEFLVDFLLAVDVNGNSRRDPGEPIFCPMREAFTDGNGNGVHDAGEAFDDLGPDGVAGTGDAGEGDGAYSYTPNVANWFARSPAARARSGEIDATSRYRGGLYADAATDDYWPFATHAASLASAINAHYLTVDEPDPAYCLRFEAGLYDGFIGGFPSPTEPIWFASKHASLLFESEAAPDDIEQKHTGSEAVRVARYNHVLSFASSRVANGLFGDDPKDSRPYYQTRAFAASTFGEDVVVEYGVFLPAGYYDERSRWKTYPLLLVFLDRGKTPNDMDQLVEAQGALAARGYAQQVVMVLVSGDASPAGREGYSFFFDPTASEFPGEFRRMIVNDLLPHLERQYRIKSRDPREDDDRFE
ncbi:hypothetical protein K8I61_18085 [bacterium]|nr:hypothetical protein [bacterium]